MRTLAGLILLLSACAHAPPPDGPAQPPGHPRAAPSPGHGRRPFPFPLRDGHTGQPLSSGSLLARLMAARVIYAGEHHTDAASHDAQLAVLGRLYALERDLAVGVEMLPRAMQAPLDDYLAGKLDEEAFLRAVRWDDTWGYDFALYRPIFAFCRAHGLRMHALNAPRELVRAVRRQGIAGLPAELRAALPDGYPWPQPEAHRQLLRAVFEQHPEAVKQADAGKGADEAFARFYLAQLVWDEAMAQSVAQVLSGAGAPRKLLVLAGAGHIGPYGIPSRAARRRPEATALTIVPEDAAGHGARAADVLVVTSEGS